jgi:hypothetical protein
MAPAAITETMVFISPPRCREQLRGHALVTYRVRRKIVRAL